MKPIMFLIVEEESVLAALHGDLDRRFGRDCRIVGERSAKAALESLKSLSDRREPVALLIADQDMSSMSGVEFLAKARAYFPSAKRILLVERDYRASNPSVSAMLLGQIDYHMVKPWFPELGLYPAVSEFLAAWSAQMEPQFELFRIIGPENDPRSHEIRDLLARMTMPFGFHYSDSEKGKSLLREAEQDGSRLPVVVRYDGKVFVQPTDAQILEALGGSVDLDVDDCDVIIIGAGPAGLSAAVYAASEGLSTLAIERNVSGGQAGTSSRIRNFPGFTWGIGGQDFSYRTCEQAWLFGAHMVFAQAATDIRTEGDWHVVTCESGREIRTRTVILATGVAWRRLGIPDLEAIIGAGVFYGAATSEARAMTGQDVFVVGAGNSAGQAVSSLANRARSVTLLVRGEDLRKSMSAYLIREIEQLENVSICLGTEIAGGVVNHQLEALVLKDRATGQEKTVPAAALFVMIGAEPKTDWLRGFVARSDDGYLLTGRDVPLSSWKLARAFAPGDQRARSVCRRRRALPIRQASRFGGRRRRHSRAAGSRVFGGDRAAGSVRRLLGRTRWRRCTSFAGFRALERRPSQNGWKQACRRFGSARTSGCGRYRSTATTKRAGSPSSGCRSDWRKEPFRSGCTLSSNSGFGRAARGMSCAPGPKPLARRLESTSSTFQRTS